MISFRNRTDKFLEKMIGLLVTIYIQRKIQHVTNIINNGGNYNMKCTSEVGKMSFSVTVKETKMVGEELREFTPVNAEYNLEGLKSDTTFDMEEWKNTLETGKAMVSEFRDKIATPLLNMGEKLLDRATTKAEAFFDFQMEQNKAREASRETEHKNLHKVYSDLEARVDVAESDITKVMDIVTKGFEDLKSGSGGNE